MPSIFVETRSPYFKRGTNKMAISLVVTGTIKDRQLIKVKFFFTLEYLLPCNLVHMSSDRHNGRGPHKNWSRRAKKICQAPFKSVCTNKESSLLCSMIFTGEKLTRMGSLTTRILQSLGESLPAHSPTQLQITQKFARYAWQILEERRPARFTWETSGESGKV